MLLGWRWSRWLRRLLALPLLWKALIANSLIVTFGAVAGTIITAALTRSRPNSVADELLLATASAGVVVSVLVNLLALRAALAPLRQVQTTIDAVRAGDLAARVRPSLVTDPEVERVGETLNAMLDELHEARVKLRALSAAVIAAQEEERRRISRELHDDTAQTLTSLLLYARALEEGEVAPATRAALAELREEVGTSLDGVRRLARELRPSSLDDLGLVPALEGYTREFGRRGGLPVRFQSAYGGERLPAHVELALYRIAQEALTNAAKHAGATQAEVWLVREPGAVTLSVRDNGQGFAAEDAPAARSGMGLFSMRERAELAGGALTIRSAPGEGTLVEARVPISPALPSGSTVVALA